MKSVFLSTLLFFLTVTAAAQSRWLQTVHNFGMIAEDDGPVSCTFSAINDSCEPWVITSSRATCGCTKPEYSPYPVAPGDTIEIHITFDPSGRPGPFLKKVYVNTSAESERIQLEVCGTVVGNERSVACLYPDNCSALHFSRGSFHPGTVSQKSIRTAHTKAYNSTSDTLDIKILSSPAYVKAEVTPKRLAPSEILSLTIHIDGSKCDTYGLVEDTLAISVGEERCNVPLSFTLKEDFSVLSEQQLADAPIARIQNKILDFGIIDRTDKAITRTFNIANMGKSPLSIRRIYTTTSGITATTSSDEVAPNETAEISVTIDPAQLNARLLNSPLNIICNDPSYPTVNIKLVGKVN